jgi:hypothetical protein
MLEHEAGVLFIVLGGASDARVLLGLTPSKRIHSPISPSLRARGKSENSPAPSEGSTFNVRAEYFYVASAHEGQTSPGSLG